VSHDITVLAPSGGAGGRRSSRFSALSTRWASGQPPIPPRRSAGPFQVERGRSSRRQGWQGPRRRRVIRPEMTTVYRPMLTLRFKASAIRVVGPTRAGRLADASVDPTDARKATVRRFGRSDRRAQRRARIARRCLVRATCQRLVGTSCRCLALANSKTLWGLPSGLGKGWTPVAVMMRTSWPPFTGNRHNRLVENDGHGWLALELRV